MSRDYPDRDKWLAIRKTPHKLWRKLGRFIHTGGTFVRPRKDPEENQRLERFAGVCNRNFYNTHGQ